MPDTYDTTNGPASPRVLIVTGGLLSPRDKSLPSVLRRQAAAVRASSGAWLDVQVKLLALEEMLLLAKHRRSLSFRRAAYRPAVERFFARSLDLDSPELTEVVLLTALAAEGVEASVTTFAELASDEALRDRLLAMHDCVFASSTLLRDLSEVDPLLRLLKRPHNRVVLGGALAGILHHEWPGHPCLDLLAVGYGELLVPAIVAWMRSGYRELRAPHEGRVVRKNGNQLLYSGVPASKDLDFLPTPDWQLAERVHGRRFRMVHYESVRGCPYRCGFCNYPFLFDDTKFRTKSAERIADDWESASDSSIARSG
ncbi:MAG: hypothetical protein MUE69_09830 [Myxococcota bacterium]|nr:hypothetical protein [Myxococcota bacterium]